MKSFTVTYHHTCNYGATLQAYALQQVMNSFGAENTVMEYADQKKPTPPKSIRGWVRNKLYKALLIYRRNELQKLEQSFLAFHKNHLTLSKKYSDMDDLRENAPDAEILITGSDQVWNIRTNPEMVPARFLDFGKPNAVRFSYAASVGLCKYSEEEKRQLSDYLKRFKGISLRESTATEFFSDLTGKECETVCDPVLLLDAEDWRRLAKKRRITQKPFILCYCVQGHKRLSEIVTTIKKQTGFDVVFIHCDPIKRCRADYHMFDLSPEEFLGMFDDAAIVISTSFHGTAFALEFGKPIYALVHDVNDARISNLMEYVGLSEYIIRSDSRIPMIPKNIKTAEEKLMLFREQSLAYVKRMIG